MIIDMKTKEKILAHLNEVPYNKSARNRIIGYLLGAGIVEKGEVVNFVECPLGQKLNDFDVFYEWFELEECPLYGLFNFLQDKQDEAIEDGDMETANKIAGYMGFLVEESTSNIRK